VKEKQTTGAEEYQDLVELLFELSNLDRLQLLNGLRSNKLKLSQIAQKTSSSVQETARHLKRLSDAGLVDKNSSGEYFITTIGSLCLDQIESIKFVVQNRNYLLEHDLTILPQKFVHRIGELLQSNRVTTVTDVLHHTEEVLKGAREYVFLMADQALLPTSTSAVGLVANSVVIWKSIIPGSVFGSLSVLGVVPENIEIRFLDNPKVGIAMNERLAGVTFSDLKGR
jgi:predicted transcriptional regulator